MPRQPQGSGSGSLGATGGTWDGACWLPLAAIPRPHWPSSALSHGGPLATALAAPVQLSRRYDQVTPDAGIVLSMRHGEKMPFVFQGIRRCLVFADLGARVWGSSMFRFVRNRQRGRAGFVEEFFSNPDVPRNSSSRAPVPHLHHTIHPSHPPFISHTGRQQISLVSEPEPAPPKLKLAGLPRQLHVDFASTRRNRSSEQKQTGLGVLDNPGQPFLQVRARHGAAPQNVPPMGPDLIKPQSLTSSGASSASIGNRGEEWTKKRKRPALDNSSPVMHPMTSVLFANTRRLAPERRCSSQDSLATAAKHRGHGQPTSSWSSPCSSSRQSSTRSLSVASTTQIRASVFSK